MSDRSLASDLVLTEKRHFLQGVSLWGRLKLEFGPGLEPDFISQLWDSQRTQFSAAWGIFTVWLLIHIIFGSLQVSIDADEYLSSLGKVSRLVPSDPKENAQVMHLIYICCSFLLALMCCLFTGLDVAGRGAEALFGRHRFHVHAGVSALVLWFITSMNLFASGQAQVLYLEEVAFGLSCFSLVLQLRCFYTLAWVLLTLITMWISVAAFNYTMLICPALIITIIGIISIVAARSREHTIRAYFLALRISDFFSENFRLILSDLMPPVAVDHLLRAHNNATGELHGGEFGRFFPSASVLFISVNLHDAPLSPAELIADLNVVFALLDAEVNLHPGALKIKTVCGVYMVAAGVPDETPDHAELLAILALRMQDRVAGHHWRTGEPLRVRFGIHSGPLCGGIASKSLPRYDVFGDSVNTASRMMSISSCGDITLSDATARALIKRAKKGEGDPRAGLDDVLERRGSVESNVCEVDMDAEQGRTIRICFHAGMDKVYGVLVEHGEMVEVKGKGLMKTWCLTSPDKMLGAAGGNRVREAGGPRAQRENGEQDIEISSRRALVGLQGSTSIGAAEGACLPRDGSWHGVEDAAGMGGGGGDGREVKQTARVRHLKSGKHLDLHMLAPQPMETQASGKGHWFEEMRKAHHSPHHWRHKFVGFLHVQAKSLEHLLPHLSRKHREQLQKDRQDSGWEDFFKHEAVEGFYEGLERLPVDQIQFDPERPYHPWFLYFYNPTLEALYKHRKMQHRMKHRLLGCLAVTVVCLVLFLVDVQLMQDKGYRSMVVASSVALALQVFASVSQWWLVQRSGEFAMPHSDAESTQLKTMLLLHEIVPSVHLVATFWILTGSTRMLSEEDLGKIAEHSIGLGQVLCFNRITSFLILASVDGVWKIPSLCLCNVLVVAVLVHHVVAPLWINDTILQSVSSSYAHVTSRGAFQNIIPMICCVLVICFSRWITDVEERRELCGIVQAQLVRRRVEMAVRSLIPPHVLKAQMRAVVAKQQSRSTASIDGVQQFHASLQQASEHGKESKASRLESALARPALDSYDTSQGGMSRQVSEDSSAHQQTAAVAMASSFFPEFLPRVVLLMADIQGFTSLSSGLNARELFAAINELFTEFDVLCALWDITKVETIGDAYLCAAGLDKPQGATMEDAYHILQMSLAVQRTLRSRGLHAIKGKNIRMRIGLHCGPVIAGIVGIKSPRYHLFGPSVDIVMALEASGDPTGVVVSAAFHDLLMSGCLVGGSLDERAQETIKASRMLASKEELQRAERDGKAEVGRDLSAELLQDDGVYMSDTVVAKNGFVERGSPTANDATREGMSLWWSQHTDALSRRTSSASLCYAIPDADAGSEPSPSTPTHYDTSDVQHVTYDKSDRAVRVESASTHVKMDAEDERERDEMLELLFSAGEEEGEGGRGKDGAPHWSGPMRKASLDTANLALQVDERPLGTATTVLGPSTGSVTTVLGSHTLLDTSDNSGPVDWFITRALPPTPAHGTAAPAALGETQSPWPGKARPAQLRAELDTEDGEALPDYAVSSASRGPLPGPATLVPSTLSVALQQAGAVAWPSLQTMQGQELVGHGAAPRAEHLNTLNHTSDSWVVLGNHFGSPTPPSSDGRNVRAGNDANDTEDSPVARGSQGSKRRSVQSPKSAAASPRSLRHKLAFRRGSLSKHFSSMLSVMSVRSSASVSSTRSVVLKSNARTRNSGPLTRKHMHFFARLYDASDKALSDIEGIIHRYSSGMSQTRADSGIRETILPLYIVQEVPGSRPFSEETNLDGTLNRSMHGYLDRNWMDGTCATVPASCDDQNWMDDTDRTVPASSVLQGPGFSSSVRSVNT